EPLRAAASQDLRPGRQRHRDLQLHDLALGRNPPAPAAGDDVAHARLRHPVLRRELPIAHLRRMIRPAVLEHAIDLCIGQHRARVSLADTVRHQTAILANRSGVRSSRSTLFRTSHTACRTDGGASSPSERAHTGPKHRRPMRAAGRFNGRRQWAQIMPASPRPSRPACCCSAC
ncbi:hypothetical protein RZS08_07350, partial [Arthrospira platensis SPKY1]|nr:hypothetical protein [Arthrospira platensis SPKY1]